MSYNTDLQAQNARLQNLLDTINALPEAGAGEPTLQEKTVSPSTSSQTVTPDSGYDGLSKVTVNAMTTATQATPSISVSSGGLITASATQTAGYVSAGTKSATKQLTVQAAQTITPSTENKTIASGQYLTGTQTIKGDANLIPANIAKGVSIFGVTGTHEGSEDLSAEITAQQELIAELQSTLDSKAAGSGGSVETCTVNISSSVLIHFISYTTIDDSGNIIYEYVTPNSSTGQNLTCVCGSTISIAASTSSMPSDEPDLTNATSICTRLSFGAYRLIASNGETARISISDPDSGGSVD